MNARETIAAQSRFRRPEDLANALREFHIARQPITRHFARQIGWFTNTQFMMYPDGRLEVRELAPGALELLKLHDVMVSDLAKSFGLEEYFVAPDYSKKAPDLTQPINSVA